MPELDRRRFLQRTAHVLGGAVLLGAGPTLLGACGDDDDDSVAAATGGASDTSGVASLGGVRQAFNWIADVEWASWYLADSLGFFTANGVDVTLQHGGPNTPAVPQIIAAGDADIGIASDELQLLDANAEGGDYVIIAASYQRSPFGYCWLADTPITGPADLVGKRIGGVQGDQIRIEAVFTINGLPVDYEFVPMSYDPQPLVDGEMDVITAYVTNQPIALGLQGVETHSTTFSDFGLKSYGDVIFASRSWLDAHHDLVVAFLRALTQGAQANIDDPAQVVDLTVDVYGADADLDPEFETQANAAYIPLMSSDFTATNGLLSLDLDYLRDEVFPGYVAAGRTDLPAVEDFADPSFLAEAHA